jgi:hypothetical protein
MSMFIYRWCLQLALKANNQDPLNGNAPRCALPYEKLQPDWARFWPESGHKLIKAAVIERDAIRHWFCLAACYE